MVDLFTMIHLEAGACLHTSVVKVGGLVIWSGGSMLKNWGNAPS